MFDVFYSGTKPNLFPHERRADSVEHAQSLSGTRYFWWVNYLTDYSNHDFLWEPAPWESTQAHVWPSQHQANGGTWLVPKQGYTDVNRNHSVLPRQGSVARVGIDHGRGLDIQCKYSTRFIGDYLGTLRRVLSRVEEEYVWVVSSVCDYTDFDWTWHPSEWQDRMLHVWPSNEQKFGDTFYVHVPSFLEKTKNLALLEWFDTIHFVEHGAVPRKPVPVHQHTADSHVGEVWNYDFQDPVVQFVRYQALAARVPAINLWRPETRAIVPLTAGASSVLVPRDAKNTLKTQLYDYPVIDRTHRKHWSLDRALDIVFLSNGESTADELYAHLQRSAGAHNRVCRVDGVNGRIASQRAAAAAAETEYYFVVPGKLAVEPGFNWSWHPDMLQQPKHYIFHALNPVNGLEYGHMAMVCYNKQLVLATQGTGLDFTMEQLHEVVPVRSGTAYYNETPWTCWRTAFREVLKLQHSLPDVDSEYRIQRWLSIPNPGTNMPNEQWSRWGAEDALDYYNAVQGNFDELRKSYEWAWLASYALIRRGLVAE